MNRRALRPGGWRQTRSRLFDLALDAEIADVHRRLEASAGRQHRHDLVNAFTAVEGAATIIGRESLSVADRSMLASILDSGLIRLHDLLLSEAAVEKVALAEVARSVAHELGGPERIRVEVAPELILTVAPGPAGRVGETIRQLVTYATRRAPTSPMTIRADQGVDGIELWVDDLGHQFSARQRRALGRRRLGGPRLGSRMLGGRRLGGPRLGGRRLGGPRLGGRRLGPRALGGRRFGGPEGLNGLDVAIRLAGEQGAQVTVEARPGGGESFGISWPAPLE